jgi:hypothetical protein
MMQLLFGKQITYSLAAIARLGVADHMGATPISIETLAEKVDAHGPSLYPVMRMLTSVGVFRETERQFALTRIVGPPPRSSGDLSSGNGRLFRRIASGDLGNVRFQRD